MPWWLVPTTADFGMRVAAETMEQMFAEAAKGMQDLVLSRDAAKASLSLPREGDVWRVPATPLDLERSLVRWLDELIYQAEGEGRWLVDAEVAIDHEAVHAVVEWVDAESVLRDVEIKATTRHELGITTLQADEISPSVGEAPQLNGPLVVAHVVFDI